MGSKKVHVFLVAPLAKQGESEPATDEVRLIRGTLAEVEAKLRAEVSITPCDAEQAHQLSDVEIEQAAE